MNKQEAENRGEDFMQGYLIGEEDTAREIVEMFIQIKFNEGTEKLNGSNKKFVKAVKQKYNLDNAANKQV